MASVAVGSYVSDMKAVASSVSEVSDKRMVLHLSISVWEEETFVAPVRDDRRLRCEWELSDWESIEAVGAADDPTRFKVVFETPDSIDLHP